MQVGGGILAGALISYWGVKLPPVISDNPVWSNIVAAIMAGIAGGLFVFLVRWAYWPIHRRVERSGGLRAALRKNLGAQMWPVIMMASGLVAFLLLFGGGAIWAAAQLGDGAAPGLAGKPGMVAYEIERQLRAIDYLRDRFNTTTPALGTEGRQMASNMEAGIAGSTNPALLLDYAKRVETELNDLQTVVRNNDQYPEIRRCFPGVANPYRNIHPYEAVASARNLAKEIQERGPVAIAGLRSNTHFISFAAAVIELGNWAGENSNGLAAARKEVLAIPVAQSSN